MNEFLHLFGRNTDLLDEIDQIETLNDLNYFNLIELNEIALIFKCQTHGLSLPHSSVLFVLSLMRHSTFDIYNVSLHVVNANETHVKAPGLISPIQNMKQLFVDTALTFGIIMEWKYEWVKMCASTFAQHWCMFNIVVVVWTIWVRNSACIFWNCSYSNHAVLFVRQNFRPYESYWIGRPFCSWLLVTSWHNHSI